LSNEGKGGAEVKKALHISVISIIIIAIMFAALMIFLRYDEKGEENMPFEISKISIISTVDAQDVEDDNNKWHKLLEQDNDIYIYINKNQNYEKIEAIKEIKLNNFKIVTSPQKGEISFYKPSTDKNEIFESKEEYKMQEIQFIGGQSNNLHELQISNQGGQIAFRCANEKVANYVSNEDEINYNELLKKANIKFEEIKFSFSFDMEILLENGTIFKTTIETNIPEEDIIENGKSSIEMDGKNFVFKRVTV